MVSELQQNIKDWLRRNSFFKGDKPMSTKYELIKKIL